MEYNKIKRVCEAGYAGTLCDKVTDGYILGEDGNVYPKLECNHGMQVNDKCVCSGNYAGEKCMLCKDGFTGDNCQYPKLDCKNGGTQMGEICIGCNAGWYGDLCEIENTCEGFQAECSNAEYATGNMCPKGNGFWKECLPRKNLNCAEQAPNEDKCLSCNDSEYLSGGKCLPRTNQNCATKSATEDKCLSCNTGDYLANGTCQLNTAENCATKSTTSNECETCDSANLLQDGKCYAKIADCAEGAQNGAICSQCINGWSGSDCRICASGDSNATQCYDKIANCSFQSGGVCNTCAGGYYKDGNQCLKQDEIANCQTMAENTNTCAVCSGNFDGAKCNVCKTGYTGDKCQYEVLNCQNGGTQVGDKCVCSAWYFGDLCEKALCSGGIIDGKCVAKNDSVNGEEITMDIKEDLVDKDGNKLDIVGLYSSNTYIRNAYGESSNSAIMLNNHSNKNVYGILGEKSIIYNAQGNNASASIKITNDGTGNIYGIYGSIIYNNYYGNSNKSQIDILNRSDNLVYGIYGTNSIYNTYYVGQSYSGLGTGTVKIDNIGDGVVYGLYSESYVKNAYVEHTQMAGSYYSGHGNEKGEILIKNDGNADVYGIYSLSTSYNAYDDDGGNAIGVIKINNKGNGNIFGMYSSVASYSTYYNYGGTAKSVISILNNGSGTAYGMFSNVVSHTTTSTQTSSITMANIASGLAIGTYSTASATNSGDITIHNLGEGTAVGMYVSGGTATNKGTINITRADYVDDNLTEDDDSDDFTYRATSATGGTAIGIYAASGSDVTNSGTIAIDGATNAYGIYAEEGATVTNGGTITIGGNSCNGSSCGEIDGNKAYIKLNGAKLFQDGKLISGNSMDLASIGGEVIASATSSFEVNGALSGNLIMNSNIVTEGFENVYTTKGTIQADDASGLKLVSQSALFDAKLAENGSDVNLTMKPFNAVVKNRSLADFLQKNYAANNNEALFNNLKSVESVAALNGNLKDFIGKEMFSRFAFEDFTILRELNHDIHNKLFNNDEDYISVGGNTSSFAFSGNSRYSLANEQSGNRSVGFSVAFSDINSSDGNKHNQRNERLYNISMPMGYHKKGFNFISTPRIGYSYGTYDRRGFNRQNYDGTVEKQMFALMNEARYPLKLKGWTIAPAAEFNFVDYHIKGREDQREYALNIKAQDSYSIEAGIGLYADTKKQFTKNSSLSFNGGVALYHEFADPYKIKLGMQGMDGAFTIRDENRSDNRAVVRTGFDFDYDNISVIGNVISYIDREYQTDATLDFKFGF